MCSLFKLYWSCLLYTSICKTLLQIICMVHLVYDSKHTTIENLVHWTTVEIWKLLLLNILDKLLCRLTQI